MPRQQRSPVDARRGTPLWGVNSLRSDALTNLLDDLFLLEKSGLDDEQCQKVKTALGLVTNRATSLPDGSFWRTSIYSELERFEHAYIDWNSGSKFEPDTDRRHRDACLKKLRRQRQRIAKKIRVNQYILQNEIDLRFVDDMYDALGGLIRALPNVFMELQKSVDRYHAKKQG